MLCKKRLFEELIAPLHLMLQLSAEAYQKYLRNKIFLLAEALRVSNKRIENILLMKANLVPEQINVDVLALLSHYDSWFTQFRLYKKKMKPEPGDAFIFEILDTQNRFPREAEQHIYQYYFKLKEELAKERTIEHSQ